MRALTVQQPWAWAIIHGGKTIENRRQPWSYRGPLVIHAGQRWSDRGGRSGAIWDALRTELGIPTGPVSAREQWARLFPLGAAIGVVDLVDVHPAAVGGCCEPWGEWTPDTCHLVLENPRPMRSPILARGRLGLWHDVDLFAEVRSQLRGAA